MLRRADRVLVVAPGGVRPDRPTRALLTRIARTAPEVPRELVLVRQAGHPSPGITELWREAGGFTRQSHLLAGAEADWRRLGRHLTGKATGVVLGGGGARGFAHIGVLRALIESGVEIDRVGGSSMGALVGGLWSIGLTPEEIVEANREIWHEIRPLKGFTFPFVALHGSHRSRTAMAGCFGERRIEDQARDFFCTSTNLTRNRSMVHTSGPLARYVLASVSIPGIVAPVIDRGELLVDGGVLDNLPVDPMSRTGAGTIYASDVSPPRTFSVGLHWEHAPGIIDVIRHRLRRERVRRSRASCGSSSAPRPSPATGPPRRSGCAATCDSSRRRSRRTTPWTCDTWTRSSRSATGRRSRRSPSGRRRAMTSN